MEALSSTLLLCRILAWRFKPGETVRVCCVERGPVMQAKARGLSFVVALALGFVVVGGLATNVALNLASTKHFLTRFGLNRHHAGQDVELLGAREDMDLRLLRSTMNSMIVAPVFEEVAFRGIVFDHLVAVGIDHRRAAAIGSLLFGAMHILGAIVSNKTRTHVYFGAALASLGGYIYCLLLWLGGSLVPCILLHCLNNLSASFYKTEENMELLFNSPSLNSGPSEGGNAEDSQLEALLLLISYGVTVVIHGIAAIICSLYPVSRAK